MIRHETGAWCGMTLRRTSWQQKPVSETKRSIAHPVLYWQELIPFNQRTCRIIFKMCFSRSCMPSQVTRHILEVLLTQTHFGHPKLSGKCYITPLYPKLKSPFKKWVYAIDSFMRYGQFKSPVTRVVTPTPIFFYQVLISGIKMQKRRLFHHFVLEIYLI